MTVADLLHAPETWTQKTWARDRNGKKCDPESPKAVRWCLIGAVQHCTKTVKACNAKYQRLEAAIKAVSGSRNISQWNDDPSRTFAEIRQVIEQAKI